MSLSALSHAPRYFSLEPKVIPCYSLGVAPIDHLHYPEPSFSCRVVRRDVSLENVMVDKRGACNLIDFGLSRRVSDDDNGPPVFLRATCCYGKDAYISPEMAYLLPLDPFASDVWSLGVLIYILLTGRPLYASPTDQAFQSLRQGNLGALLESYGAYGVTSISPLALDLLGSMLHPDPCLRLTLAGVRDHPWVCAR